MARTVFSLKRLLKQRFVQRRHAVEALIIVARSRNVIIADEELDRLLTQGSDAITVDNVIDIASQLGLIARVRRFAWTELFARSAAAPFLCIDDDGGIFLLTNVQRASKEYPDGSVQIARFTKAWNASTVGYDDIKYSWNGMLLYFDRRDLRQAKSCAMQWTLDAVFRYRCYLVQALSLAVLLNVVGLAIPLFFQVITNRVLPNSSVETLHVAAAMVAILLLYAAGMSWVRSYILAYVGARVDAQLAVDIFARALNLPLSYFNAMPTGQLTRQLQQVDEMRTFLTGQALSSILDITCIVVVIPVLILYSPILSIVVLGAALLLMLIVAFVIRPLSQMLKLLYKSEAERQSLLVETLYSIETIKALATETQRQWKWNDRVTETAFNSFNIARLTAVTTAALQAAEKGMIVLILVVGAGEVINHKISVGALVAFQMLAAQLIGPLIRLVVMLNEVEKLKVSLQALSTLFAVTPEGRFDNNGVMPRLRGNITFEHVHFSYPGRRERAISDVSFTIRAGEFIVIVGSSGSGKSTITKLLQRLYEPDSGFIRMDKWNARELNLGHTRRSIGVVLQDTVLFRGTIRQNICQGAFKASADDLAWALDSSGANEYVNALPRGVETELDERGSNLSGGQRQRLGLARALIRKPAVLLLDEVTSALDVHSEKVVLSALAGLRGTCTIVLVSHRLSSALVADRIIVMSKGRVASIGRHDDLLSACDEYQHLWKSYRDYERPQVDGAAAGRHSLKEVRRAGRAD